MTACRIILFVICLCLISGLAAAQEPLPRASGFSGDIEILGAYISTSSQLNTDSDNKKIGLTMKKAVPFCYHSPTALYRRAI
jgi:hypothetical protein